MYVCMYVCIHVCIALYYKTDALSKIQCVQVCKAYYRQRQGRGLDVHRQQRYLVQRLRRTEQPLLQPAPKRYRQTLSIHTYIHTYIYSFIYDVCMYWSTTRRL